MWELSSGNLKPKVSKFLNVLVLWRISSLNTNFPISREVISPLFRPPYWCSFPWLALHCLPFSSGMIGRSQLLTVVQCTGGQWNLHVKRLLLCVRSHCLGPTDSVSSLTVLYGYCISFVHKCSTAFLLNLFPWPKAGAFSRYKCVKGGHLYILEKYKQIALEENCYCTLILRENWFIIMK